jgi:hypothetical protein
MTSMVTAAITIARMPLPPKRYVATGRTGSARTAPTSGQRVVSATATTAPTMKR